LASNFKAYQYF